ncbi:SDR family NAD(P)-dependent oxidoreductase [Pelagibacteraceae bacterium]|nr:SDR family NAD(P)-dependent oxidoreductase [Pelagibacteraceae bacterium]
MNESLLIKKNVIITGCNRGIGKSVLEKFSENGANCFACVRKITEEFKEFCKKKSIDTNTIIKIFELDLSSSESVKNCYLNILKEEKNLDVLINNAGIAHNSLLHMTTEKNLKDIFQVNFFSQMMFTQMISKEMLKKKSGKIIFVSSTAAERADEGRFVYASSKAAIYSAVRTLSKELGNFSIQVNSVSPGLTRTDILKKTSQKILDEETKRISLKRIGEPDEIANVILFLSSQLSNYISGQNIKVDGGTF